MQKAINQQNIICLFKKFQQYDIIINIICIPLFGATGAAFGTLIAEICVFTVQLYYLREMVLPILASYNYSQVFLGTVLSGIFASSIKYIPAPSIVRLIISAIVFFGIYLIFMLIKRNCAVVEIWNTVLRKIGMSRFLINNKDQN